MKKLNWLVDKLQAPCILHDQSTILYANTSFINLLAENNNLTQLNFIDWLSSVIKNKTDAGSLIDAIKNNREIILDTDAHMKGALFHWKIYSSPAPQKTTAQPCCVTWLQDVSSAYLAKSYWEVHLRVSKAIMEVMKETNQRKKADERAKLLQEELIATSREAGMAEISASVLHNIGNILNSVGVSLALLDEKINAPVFQKTTLLSAMLNEHQDNLIDYFQNDEKGKLLPNYLTTLFGELQHHNATLSGEIKHLKDQYQLIKETLSAVSGFFKKAPVIEKVFLPELVDSAIQLSISKNTTISKNIVVDKIYEYSSFVMTEKAPLMQVMINLIKNAKESLIEINENKTRTININISNKKNPNEIMISVIDNGMGIPTDAMKKLFTFGFTTKKRGHGFGLHNCSLIAKQLGGTLTAESEGVDKGATFILTLPISNKQKIGVSK